MKPGRTDPAARLPGHPDTRGGGASSSQEEERTTRRVWGLPAGDVVAILHSGSTKDRDPRAESIFESIRSEWVRIGRARYPELADELHDAVQAALVKLISPGKLATLADPERVDVWARSIFVNTVLDFVRQGRRARSRQAPDADGEGADLVDRLPARTMGPEAAARQRELATIVRRAFGGLEAARLRYAEDLPERAIAERLGVSRDAVATRLRRFRQRLRAMLDDRAAVRRSRS